MSSRSGPSLAVAFSALFFHSHLKMTISITGIMNAVTRNINNTISTAATTVMIKFACFLGFVRKGVVDTNDIIEADDGLTDLHVRDRMDRVVGNEVKSCCDSVIIMEVLVPAPVLVLVLELILVLVFEDCSAIGLM